MSDDQRQRFSELYAALYGRVRAYAARRVGADAADEVAAETFTIAWRLRFEVDLVRYGTTSSGASPAHPRRAPPPPTH